MGAKNAASYDSGGGQVLAAAGQRRLSEAAAASYLRGPFSPNGRHAKRRRPCVTLWRGACRVLTRPRPPCRAELALKPPPQLGAMACSRQHTLPYSSVCRPLPWPATHAAQPAPGVVRAALPPRAPPRPAVRGPAVTVYAGWPRHPPLAYQAAVTVPAAYTL